MSRETVNTLCRALPGATWSDPWGGGHDAWKVGGRMFACIGAQGLGVAVKTPSVADAEALIGMERATRAPYFHRSWVLVDWNRVSEAELGDRIDTSYRIILGGLTQKARREITGP